MFLQDFREGKVIYANRGQSSQIGDAIIFAQGLPDKIKSPFISWAEDGELNFWWDFKSIQVDLGFYGDGYYSYYATLSNGLEFFGDEIPVAQSLPSEVQEVLKIC